MKTLLLFLTLQSVSTYSNETKTEISKASFIAKTNNQAMKISGETKETVQAKIELTGKELTGSFIANLDSLETGISLRDKHLKENYLETSQFKNASFQLKPIHRSDFDVAIKKGTDLIVEGELELHGVKKPITVKLLPKLSNINLEMILTTEINLTQFSIKLPEFLGIKVNEMVSVEYQYKGIL